MPPCSVIKNLRRNKNIKLTNIERETIILFNEHEKVAEIYTHNKKLIRKIKTANEKHPELFKIKREDKNGAVTLELPKDRLSINIKMSPKKEISEFRSKMAKDRHKATSNNPQICTNLESESIA